MIEYLTIPHELMNRKNPLHYALFNFDNNSEMKLFITILAYSTMIYRSTKKTENHHFKLKGFLGNDSVLNRRDLTHKKINLFIQKLDSSFFEEIKVEANEVIFKFSRQYKKAIKSGFNKIDLNTLKSIKDVRATKLTILTQMKTDGYFDLYYLFKVLELNEIKRRDHKIAKIKSAFSKLKNIEYSYKHPKNQNAEKLDDHYKFHYKTLIETVIKTAENDSLDNIFDTADIDDIDDLDIEEEEKNEPWQMSKAEINEQLEEFEQKSQPIIGKTDYLNYV
ncbi:hypothetical protein ACU5B6_13095 [Moritella viscosa]|uniref:hypothetical protein n=1 Tax=Moritella viscosa TaxID=80854 RepID=UPI00091A3017|nr:hypothetical protein [Moritella viscosa]SHO15747.1 Molybdenum cofactor biosynthesis protein A [Moritella viscosa]SHO16098.1 Molybdenum cofactor biosynthesis protein A [Moritella viscosa]SHO18821.1 Molybdenum cofactor biosynthesis protein A [Moritella viscosa]